MKKLILFIFFLSVLFVSVSPALADKDSYNVQREGNNITLITTTPKIPRVAGIPNLVGTITGTTFTGKAYLIADECPNLDGYVPANGTVSEDGSSITVTYNTTDYYYTTCVEKANSESKVTKTYSIAAPSPKETITDAPTFDYGIRDIAKFNREILDIEKVQRKIDQCPPPHVPSDSECVSGALSQFELPTYLKDIAIEPGFTNKIVFDESKVQIISFPEGMKEASDYPMNSISTNFTKFSEDFEIVVNNSGKLPILNLSPKYHTEVGPQIQPYFVADSSGESSMLTSSASKPGSNYSWDWKSLVTLDADVNSNSAISKTIGLVLDSNALVTLVNSNNQSVMEISNGARIVVAGFAADDTLEAAEEFISQLKNLDNE